MKFRSRFLPWAALLLLLALLSACAPPAAAAIPTPFALAASHTPAPTTDPFYQATGGGDPRSIGYWRLWNTCAPDNMAETARANGGREAGWLLMDDLLADPGVWLADMPVQDCPQGLNLLGASASDDPTYTLAAQLLAAMLNQFAGSYSCPAADQAVLGASALLAGLNFDGSGEYLAPPHAGEEVDAAQELAETLAQYNGGRLCLP